MSTTSSSRALLAQRLALFAIVALAASLRFTGLAMGLRHVPHQDESDYVINTRTMVEAGDLDHRFYRYPGLFFYLLAPGIAWLGPGRAHGPEVYLVSRALIAAAGSLNPALLAWVARRLGHPLAGLAGALLLAVSPVGVQTAHEVRPDVLLEGFGILLLPLLFRTGPELRHDVRAGALIGVATAVKFTGLLMLPGYLLARWLQPGPRLRGSAAAVALAVALPVIFTPYAILHRARYGPGVEHQMTMYYRGAESPLWRNLGYYTGDAAATLGSAASALVLAGLILALRREGRRWLPALVHPVVVLVVMSTPALVFPRLILPAMGVVSLLAGLAVEALASYSPPAAVVVALVAAALPLRTSLPWVQRAAQPSAQDRALDWIEAVAPPRAVILETRPDARVGGRGGATVGVDRTRFELLEHFADEDKDALGLLVRHVDYVITGPGLGGRWGTSLTPLLQARGPQGALVLQIKAPAARATYQPLDLSRARVTSSAPGVEGALVDGNSRTLWQTPGALEGTEWIEVDLPAPAPVCRVDLAVPRPPRYDPELALDVQHENGTWQPALTASGRPPLAEQAAHGHPLGQRLVLEAGRVRAFRVRQTGRRADPWSVSELRADACPSAPVL
jgi:hypothetical protein